MQVKSEEVKKIKKVGTKKGKKTKKVISILENALNFDFILKSASAAAVLFVLLSICFVPAVDAYIQLYTITLMSLFIQL